MEMMNPKKKAMMAMAEEGGSYKEPTSEEADTEEDASENEQEMNCPHCSKPVTISITLG